MEIPLDLRSIVIVATLLLGVNGDVKVAESAPRTVIMRKSFRYPDYNQMPNSEFLPEGPQLWDSQFIPTVEPHIDSLIKCTTYLIDTMRRLEVKFNRVFDVVNFEETAASDAMDKLRLIYQYIKGLRTNACQTDCSSSVNEKPQNDLMKELVDAVKYSNENIRRVVTNFDAVVESGRRSMQSLEKVVNTVQDINERTIRIQQSSIGQFSSGISHLYRDETLGIERPSIMNTRVNDGSNNYEINGHNNKFPTSINQPTQKKYDSTDRKDNKNPSIAFTKSTYESTGGDIDNWGRKLEVGDKNGNADRGHQSEMGRSTNYDGNGRVISDGSNQNRNSFPKSIDDMKVNQNVDHNEKKYQERRKDSKEGDHNKTPLASRPTVPEVNSWNSNETFNGESTRSHKPDHNGRQQIQESYGYNGIGSILDNKPPTESSPRTTVESKQSYGYNGSGSIFDNNPPIVSSPRSTVESNQSYGTDGIGAISDNKPQIDSSLRSTIESSSGEIRTWNTNSHKTSGEEIQSGVAQTNNYDAIVNEIFDKNLKADQTNNESSGHFVSKSNVQLDENENVGQKVEVTQNRTIYDSSESVVGNVNSTVISTKTNSEPSETETRSHFQNTFSYPTSGTKETQIVMEQKASIVPPATTTTTSTTTTTTTTSTAKPQTTISSRANSLRTYRSLRKDAKRVTFEPGKRNCHDLTVKRNGIYKFGSMDEVANDGDRFFYERYCDFYTDNRAWTVIQRRFADYNEESFNRTWLDYKHGFGSLDDEFWFGNDFIHKLTFDDDVELRILLEDENGKISWAEYSLFKMKSEKDNYKLVISGYSSGSVGDSLLYHNDQEFSTYDHRNGNNQQTSCALSMGNGWWFKNCSDKAILGNFLGSTSTKMMIRPKK